MTPYNYYSYPQTYQQQYNLQQPYNSPQSQQYNSQPQQQYTPPTIHAEIIQVNNEQEAKDYPVAAGNTQMFIAKDDSAIYIKTAYVNTPAQLVVYKKSEPEPEVKPDYITREEFEKRLEEFFNS